MPRRVALVVLWAVFAVASVSVGFAALGLVGDPLTDVGTTENASDLAGPGEATVTEPDATPGDQSSPTASPSASSSATPTTTQSGPGPTRTADPTRSATTTSLVKGGVPTQGGYVSGTCKGQLVSVGAAPAVYWQMKSITPGWAAHFARVRLEPAKDARGERVLVTVTCHGGGPVFHVDFKDGDDSGGSGHGGGSSDSGGG